MTASEIRQAYMDFFHDKGHTLVQSDSLVPENDPTLLFTGAGMNQFKDLFLGAENAPYTRAVSSQKCLRTGDIESVGRTASHHTFFEMLGNFSFGDYFKHEAITWAWEFLSQTLRIPRERLFVSVYKDDKEAHEIWKNEIRIKEERIYLFGEKENFWPASAPTKGPNGPCGPCSEIFFDQGESLSCGADDCGPACDCDRFVEIWNLVFTQFSRQENGALEPLPQKNIDTGMGLERMAAIMQNCQSNFETDLFMPIIRVIEDACGITYEPRTGHAARMRRIADHVRALTFTVADGVRPSNEGRGYVLRRLTRRALLDGKRLELEDPFLHKLVPIVTDVMKDAYPALAAGQAEIVRIVKAEEDKFVRTLDRGLVVLEEKIAKIKKSGDSKLSGETAFELYDTYGFPLEMTEEYLFARELTLDRRGFHHEMDKQKERARAGSNIAKDIFAADVFTEIKRTCSSTRFVGYEQTSSEAEVKAVMANGKLIDEAGVDTDVVLILDQTPFYAEAGGQVGDQGMIHCPSGRFKVKTTRASEDVHLHYGKIVEGTFKVGARVQADVDVESKNAIQRNHTATHLLHWAIGELLGPHIQQAGSLVEADRLRFDFTHDQALGLVQIHEIERLIHSRIVRDYPVETLEMSLDEARKTGAKALFNEKYGDTVRVVKIGKVSQELCGGTHVFRTGEIGFVKISKEESIGSGVRRIEAMTGLKALEAIQKSESRITAAARILKTSPEQLGERVNKLLQEIKDLKKNASGNRGAGGLKVGQILEKAEKTAGVSLAAIDMGEASAEDLRLAADALRKESVPFAALLAGRKDNRPLLIVCTNVPERINAVDVVRKAAKAVQGGGGGRPDMAQAGGKKPEGIPQALEIGLEVARGLLAE